MEHDAKKRKREKRRHVPEAAKVAFRMRKGDG
jgi:hypothetical protein